MGSDLSTAPEGKAPGLLIQAVRDAAGAKLDRLQVVKGYIDEGTGRRRRKFIMSRFSSERELKDG